MRSRRERSPALSKVGPRPPAEAGAEASPESRNRGGEVGRSADFVEQGRLAGVSADVSRRKVSADRKWPPLCSRSITRVSKEAWASYRCLKEKGYVEPSAESSPESAAESAAPTKATLQELGDEVGGNAGFAEEGDPPVRRVAGEWPGGRVSVV